jgi:hypothetical protein
VCDVWRVRCLTCRACAQIDSFVSNIEKTNGCDMSMSANVERTRINTLNGGLDFMSYALEVRVTVFVRGSEP